jgi:hypothetical protein
VDGSDTERLRHGLPADDAESDGIESCEQYSTHGLFVAR